MLKAPPLETFAAVAKSPVCTSRIVPSPVAYQSRDACAVLRVLSRKKSGRAFSGSDPLRDFNATCTLSVMVDVVETFVKWEPVEGITFDFISAEVFSSHTDLWVRLVDGRVDVLEHRDLIFHFSRVAGFAVHEEFAHPSQGTVWGREPVISPKCRATFPCLVVTGSSWFKSLGDELEISYAGAQHYRLCSNFPVIDVISPERPVVRWLTRPKSKQESSLPSWTTGA